MFVKESRWIISVLDKYAKAETLKTAIDVGSGGSKYLRKPQNKSIYSYLTGKGIIISTLDNGSREATYKCDITKDLPQNLRSCQFDLVLCTSLLEHVTGIEETAGNLLKLLKSPEGYLLVTVPRSFPHHPRPIDNGYRPTNKELERLFPNLCVLYSETFEADRDKPLHEIICRSLPVVSGVLFRS